MFLPRESLLNQLSTYISKHKMPKVMKSFLAQYPRHLREFLIDPEFVQSITNETLLLKLLKIGSKFDFEALYFRAYAALLSIDKRPETVPMLHQHLFTEEDITTIMANKESPFVALIAEDGSRSGHRL